MVSTLAFQFDPRDKVTLARALSLFLRTTLDTLKRVQQLIADTGADDAFLQLAILRRVIPEHFGRCDRGPLKVDPDMTENVIGPLSRCLFAFKGIVADSVVQDFNKALM